MTTNHIEKLDPALVRPGRADLKLLFDNATPAQARRLFERFFPDAVELAVEFAGEIADREHSMAAIQEYLMSHRHDPRAAIRNVGRLRESLAASSNEPKTPRPRKKRRRAALSLARTALASERQGAD